MLHLLAHADYLQAIWHFVSESSERAIRQKDGTEVPEDMICSTVCVCV